MYSGLNQNFIQHNRRINIEGSTRCPLLCPGCSRTQDILGLDDRTRTWEIADMDLENFKLLVREENKLRVITYNMALSDPIYCGNLFDQLKHLNSLLHRPNVVMSTNGSGKAKQWWQEFAGLLYGHKDRIEFAIDGLEDTNHIYRVNSKWDTIIEGIKTLRKNFQGPIMWRFIVFEHNYHQVAEAKQLAADLGINRFQAMLGDARTPTHMQLKSADWNQILETIS